MSSPLTSIPTETLFRIGLQIDETMHYQLNPAELTEDTIRLGEGMLSDSGALVINTGAFTGRSPKDRFIVKDEITVDTVNWNDFNQPLEEKYFHRILDRVTNYLNSLPEIWVRDCFACADKRFRLGIRVINDQPAHNLFAHNMFIRPQEEELDNFKPNWHILSAPGLQLIPGECGINNPNAVVISFRHRVICIAGTGYTGETKKAIFTILNYLLPKEKNVLSMHCAANKGKNGDVAIFFGLSGTGKTTLSADPHRFLIGDDEHGWTSDSIFNFEGGCYAKCIHLSEQKEPQIYQAVRPGALVENTHFFQQGRQINFDDSSITENTRVSYPLHFINNADRKSTGNIPENIFFLTCDAYGVLPPISRLSIGQAMYQFISGYTAKVAGTETGIKEPKSTFSACFGAPFLPLHPAKYAAMLGEKMKDHHVKVWLINTGWTGGPYLKGSRIKLSYTRAMISAVLENKLTEVEYTKDEIFGMAVPLECPGVPSRMLIPKNTWASEKDYDLAAKELATQFKKNFEKYAGAVSEEIKTAGPSI